MMFFNDNKPHGHWVGWESCDATEIHIMQSKRYVILKMEGGFRYKKTTVCGVTVPAHASTCCGDEPCKRCEAWFDKNVAGSPYDNTF